MNNTTLDIKTDVCVRSGYLDVMISTFTKRRDTSLARIKAILQEIAAHPIPADLRHLHILGVHEVELAAEILKLNIHEFNLARITHRFSPYDTN
jgi:hypothetical protein